MWNVTTLDGYFEGDQKWDLSFHQLIWGPDLEELSIQQLRSADYLVFGRLTYEGMAAYWKNAPDEHSEIAKLMNSIPKLIFSRTLKQVDWNNSTLVKGNAVEQISRLKEQKGHEMYVFGSADLSRTFIEKDLFDEYRIGIAPIILGSGTPLFKQGVPTIGLTHIDTQPLFKGGVVLRFSKNKIAS